MLQRLDKYATTICTVVLWVAGFYFTGILVHAWWLGRFSEVAR